MTFIVDDPDVRAALSRAGWFETRQIDITPWIERLRGEGSAVTEPRRGAAASRRRSHRRASRSRVGQIPAWAHGIRSLARGDRRVIAGQSMGGSARGAADASRRMVRRGGSTRGSRRRRVCGRRLASGPARIESRGSLAARRHRGRRAIDADRHPRRPLMSEATSSPSGRPVSSSLARARRSRRHSRPTSHAHHRAPHARRSRR